MITKKKLDALEDKICRAIGMEKEAFFWFKFEMGCEYLRHYLGDDEEAVKRMSSLKDFWSWWAQVWYQQDLGFIQSWKDQIPSDPLQFYKTFHDSAQVSLRPNCVVLRSYKRAVINFFKSITKMNDEHQ